MIKISKLKVIEKDKGNMFEKGNIPFNKGKTHDEDERILQGENHPRFGKKNLEYNKQKSREYNKQNPQERNNKTGRFKLS